MLKAARAEVPRFARQIVMTAVGAAVINMHAEAEIERPEWFSHILKRCEVKAAKIAETEALGPHACGDATFIEVYAKTLPALLTAALDAHEQALRS
jgi:hypothetical protein